MPRLFIFGIGGTGSRVLKALTMILAAGVKPNTPTDYEIVPIIIDPHKSNDDLKRTVELMEHYQAIAAAAGTDCGFFGTRISTLDNLVTTPDRLAKTFTYDLQQVAKTKFKDYIDYNQLGTANKALANILFSGTTVDHREQEIDLLDLEMEIGFVGNPNIGSVVLNQFKDSAEFKEFASCFGSDDRIFIISSIFGGTGAAGFPVVLKNIRDAINSNREIGGKGFLQDSKIGALSVLPYFNIETDAKSPIQKADFISKAKSALHYYKENISGNNSVNALYYISDDFSGKPYRNDPGHGGQRNDAHFVELAAALAVVDFLEIPDDRLSTVQGKASKPIYKEFAVKRDTGEMSFSDLDDGTQQTLALRLTQFELFRRFVTERVNSRVEEQPWNLQAPVIDGQFIRGFFFRSHLVEYASMYREWLEEMSMNRRSFAPFNLSASLSSFITGRPATSRLFASRVDYPLLEDTLNKEARGKSYQSAEKKFVDLLFRGTETLLKSRFGF